MNRPLMINSFDPAQAHDLDPVIEQLLKRRAKVLGPSYKLFYEKPVHFVRAEGVWMYDSHNTPYLDVYNNVPSVGHCHPHVVEAVSKQMALLNTHTRYLYDTVLTYAEKLIATFPEELANVMFTCTGSESSDLAVRIARCHTGNTGIIVTENAYHGITAAIAEMSPSLGEGVALGSMVRLVPAPDAYRAGDKDVGDAFAESVEAAIADMLRHGIRPAALSRQAWGQTLGSAPLMLAVGVTLLSAFGQFTLFSYFAPYFFQTLGLGGGALSLMFLWFGAFGLAGNVGLSRWIDRIGAPRAVLLTLGAMVLTLLLWPLGQAGIWQQALVLVPWALGCFACNSAQQARLVHLSPALAPATVALNTSAMYGGQALGAALGGILIAQGHMLRLHQVGLVVLILAMALSVWAARAQKRS